MIAIPAGVYLAGIRRRKDKAIRRATTSIRRPNARRIYPRHRKENQVDSTVTTYGDWIPHRFHVSDLITTDTNDDWRKLK